MTSDQLDHFLSAYEESIFGDYIDLVANKGLLEYQTVLQYGNKRGQSLYIHILDMICVLETLRPSLYLSEDETRVLYTAITIHDINKPTDEKMSFNKLATPERLADEIRRLGLEDFFPAWEVCLQDITTLVRIHSGHYHVAGESLNMKHQATYALGQQRLITLGHLIRAVDVIDLSHTLQERKHKGDFLGHLNAYLADSGIAEQYEFHTHQIVEQRGLLTNVMHNAIMEVLSEDGHLLPLLLYPDGVAYLAPKGTHIPVDEQLVAGLGQAVMNGVNEVISTVEGLVDPKAQGINIKSDALELNVSMAAVWKQVQLHVARRNFKVEELADKARTKALEHPNAGRFADYLQSDAPLINATQAQLRASEMARTYYLFLSDHFALRDAAWERVYDLLELPSENHEYYDIFDARFYRPYILAGDITLSEDEVFKRIVNDSQLLVADYVVSEDAVALWTKYVERYVLINDTLLTGDDWSDPVEHYMANQHQQCVHCSGAFPTDLWMAGDVRDNITVQVFSNRLLGGGSKEPKKSICDVCRIQFLMETINYARVRNEDPYYLHLVPYSHLTTPYLRGLQATFNALRNSGVAVQALNTDTRNAMQQIANQHPVRITMRTQTKEGKPMPYGVYIPTYSTTMAGTMVFPLNPGGGNDTEKYLFALWNALVLQRYCGMRVLMSKSPVPVIEPDVLPDVYLDMVPLAFEGLLPRNDYVQFEGDREGPLVELWHRVSALFAIRRIVFADDGEFARLVRSMSHGPLHLFFEVDRLIERKEKGPWAGRETLPHLATLAMSIGGEFMELLSKQLEQAAVVAWQHGLRGRTLKRSSLLYPTKEVLDKMELLGSAPDREAIIAATVQDVFVHLERLAEGYTPGRTKYGACEQFVRIWYDGILDGVYSGNYQRLLSDKKLLMSAYLFYVQAQIPRKAEDTEEVDSLEYESEEF